MRLLAVATMAFAASSIACAARTRMSLPRSPDPTASEFVASFYAWYVRPRATKAGSATMDDAVAEQSARFADSLLAALRADRDAQGRSPGELVGLDFDAFTASQDPCPEYTVGAATVFAGRVRVEVVAVCGGKPAPEASLIAEVERQGASWKFTNFIFDDRADLLTLLARLAADRKKYGTDRSPPADDGGRSAAG